MPAVAEPLVVWTAAAYLLVVLAIGLWAARRTRTAKDFFIAGQGIGLLVTALATMSAAFQSAAAVLTTSTPAASSDRCCIRCQTPDATSRAHGFIVAGSLDGRRSSRRHR